MKDQSVIIDTLQAYFSNQKDVVVAYLYGSQARRQSTPLSDVDIAVLLADSLTSQQRFERRLTLITELIELVKINQVDVVILNDTPLPLNYRILRDGILLHSTNEARRIMHTATTISQYLDFLPVLKRHEEAILEKARKGELLYGHNPYRGSLERYRQRRQSPSFIAESDV